MLKYEIIDVFFCVKNIPLSLKMSPASGGRSPPDSSFCGVQRVLNLYYVRYLNYMPV